MPYEQEEIERFSDGKILIIEVPDCTCEQDVVLDNLLEDLDIVENGESDVRPS